MNQLLNVEYMIPLLALFAVLFILREFFAFRSHLAMKYFLTPLVTLSIIFFVILSFHSAGISTYSALVLTGLLLAVVADTLLMIEENNYIRHGLIFFMATHASYIAALQLNADIRGWNIAAGIVLLLLALGLYRFVTMKTGKGNLPVLVYMLLIAVTVFLSFTYLNGGTVKGPLLAAGSVLFALSDCVLAVNQFVKKIRHSTVITWLLYAPAQLFIALSCFC